MPKNIFLFLAAGNICFFLVATCLQVPEIPFKYLFQSYTALSSAMEVFAIPFSERKYYLFLSACCSICLPDLLLHNLEENTFWVISYIFCNHYRTLLEEAKLIPDGETSLTSGSCARWITSSLGTTPDRKCVDMCMNRQRWGGESEVRFYRDCSRTIVNHTLTAALYRMS